MELNIKKVGMTIERDSQTVLILDGDMPPDSIVVFMDKESWETLKKEIK